MSKSKQKQAELQAADNGESKEVAKETEGIRALLSEDSLERYQRLERWNKEIDRDPPSKWVKKNKFAGGAKYLPIRIVETMLRTIYGNYQVEWEQPPKRIANSIVCSVVLKVYHPILKEWLSYAGTGAVDIQLEKGSDAIDAEKIKAKALHKNVPAAKSFAITNAAKSLGRMFGAHLNNRADEQIAHRTPYQKDDK